MFIVQIADDGYWITIHDEDGPRLFSTQVEAARFAISLRHEFRIRDAEPALIW